MAQNARIASLTDDLIQAVVDFDPDANRQAYKRAKDVASKGLKAHQYARTNQFDVQASFTGLDEKFRVLNRDVLADALKSRLNELEGRQKKWMPEYLSLLLQLSDRPVDNSQVEALELLRPPTPPTPLTWAQIIAEDPYSDEELWKDIDYAAESSEDEGIEKRREKAKSSPTTSVENEDIIDPEPCVIDVDAGILSAVEDSQFWTRTPNEESQKIEFSELQAVRETLFMLAGLQTSLYQTDKYNGSVRVVQKYTISHAIHKTMDHLLAQLADVGREVYRLRQWTQRPSSLPLIQTFEAAIKSRLGDYDRTLALLQKRYLIPHTPISVSLLELHDEIRSISRPILQLAQLVADIEPQLLVNPFIHLETLFERLSLAQMTLQKNVFDFLSHIFFECLQTYQKPIRRWMESGELGSNDETFFVFENDSSTEASSVWHDRFVLRRGKENALRSPSFLQPAAQRIFNTGKSVVFLKEFGIYGAALIGSEPEPRLDHKTVCGTGSELPLSPFPELFQAAFQTWIKSKYSLASSILREHLFSECGLMTVLNHYKYLYLGADGSVFQDFADAMFERMDDGQRSWNDRFLLTELARGIFSTVLGVSNAEKIVVRSLRTKSQSRSVKSLRNISIDLAIPWSIMNIIQRSSGRIYQQMFTFLLQTYRAKYLLQRAPLRSFHQSNNGGLLHLSYKLRQRLIWFTDMVRSYLTETVITQSAEAMCAAMLKAEGIDEMSDIHIKYVARLQEQSLLSDNLKPIHNAIISLLDLGVLFSEIHSQNIQKKPSSRSQGRIPRPPVKPASKASRRKSFIPAIVEAESSESESDADKAGKHLEQENKTDVDSFPQRLKQIDEEIGRLLPFVTAGLRSVGRVGAEPVWEMLAERLEWDKKGR
ncbi:Spc98 family-domain-containing protein [Massariosphaeria phaeospora]|uniref:Spindle pole body component n=1 Tax=Massariosphaeria phaeospora TaxID=100035 RepID=A0A7C8HZ40_9PLEO|nr:Spc98 family-domain-containing protein [Massariosphaeria phaeospora]